MTAISNRTSVLFIMAETSEGTPVLPSAATDAVAIQDDFAMSPETAVLDNVELSGSLAKRKRILGAEKPTASFSHYLRHSGVEGTAPDYKNILKTGIGTQTANGTQRVTASSSTTSLIKVASGTGGDFLRGTGMLIKDPTNGYRIRVSDSRSTDDVSISFKVPSAPASGVSLGKCVYYKPLESGHQSDDLWHYVGNGGAVELMTGARVTSLNFKFNAGELINMSTSWEGIAFYFNPITITATSKYIDFTDDDGTVAAVLAEGTYKDPKQLADAAATAMNTANSGETHTCAYDSSNGKFTFASSGTVLTLKWNTGTNTANSAAAKFGFSTAADSSGTAATTGYTSATAQDLTAPYTPSLDSSDPLAAKDNEVMLGDVNDYVCFEASEVSVSLTNQRTETKSICATTGVSGAVITQREVKAIVKALLPKYETSRFSKYRENTDARLQVSFGTKLGGNWVPGKCGYVYLTGTITAWKITNDNGLATLELEVTGATGSSGEQEFYLGFL